MSLGQGEWMNQEVWMQIARHQCDTKPGQNAKRIPEIVN